MFNSIDDLNINWLKENHQMIHYFGLGFIQLKINDEYRLHFYSPELPPIIGEEDIHNHRYDFESLILKGEFSQDLFSVVEGDTHLKTFENCSEDKVDVPSEKCSIKLISTENYKSGDKYKISHKDFHRVRAKNCITLLRRGPKVKELAEVIIPAQNQAICPFSLKIDKDTLWKIVETSIKN